jgi:hypothetical protein
MIMFDKVIEAFHSAGLITFQNPNDSQLIVATPQCASERGNFSLDHPDADYIEIRRIGNGWQLYKLEGTPYPVDSDIDCYVAHLEDAVAAVVNYLTGTPITVGDWIIPLHQHPEWVEQGVLNAISQAVHVSSSDWINAFCKIATKALPSAYGLEAYSRGPVLEITLVNMIVPIKHASETDRLLFLRRDLQKSFMVYGNENDLNECLSHNYGMYGWRGTPPI